MPTPRHYFAACLGAIFAGVTCAPSLVHAEPRRAESGKQPNILVIMSDQHSKHFLGCYGNRIVRTPNLDRLAAEGMRFTAAYCAAPVCVPSRMSFLTARTPSANRVWHNECILGSGIPTWAHALSIRGYETSLIGRMHFHGPDQRHGFENRPVGEYLAGHPGSRQLPDRILYHGGSGQDRSGVEQAGRGRTTYQYADEMKTEKAIGYLRERARSERPFAAVVGVVLPHCPFIAPKELFDYYDPRVDCPKSKRGSLPLIARLPGRIAPGSVSDAVCNLMDLGPTFAEVAGTIMPGSHGRSLWRTLTGRHPQDWPQETVSELFDGRVTSASRMIRSGKWKLWIHFDQENLPPAFFQLGGRPSRTQRPRRRSSLCGDS